MADAPKSPESSDPQHRGRIQAQGGGTEQSVPWARHTPPTESAMLKMCDDLEVKLSEREKNDRAQPLAQLRRFIRSAAQGGGVSAPVSKSWLKRGSKDIRIDLEVVKGMACVPDSPGDSSDG
ncbi:MAG: hypothetical protein ACRELG_18900 [Gemmataceae bacterium]